MDAKSITPLFGRTPDTWQANNKHLFPSEQALRWTLRQHRERLIKAGALIRLRGAWHGIEPKFTQELVKIGRADAIAAVREAA
jgi:hypothetical protein